MSEELKPLPCFNPECQCVETRMHMSVIADRNMWFVECADDKCSMHGPAKFTEQAAITAWNALPRALVWTSEPPTVEGFYWARRKNTNTLHVVRVMEIREELSVFMPGSEIDGYLHWYTLWTGPIPEPQEPKR